MSEKQHQPSKSSPATILTVTLSVIGLLTLAGIFVGLSSDAPQEEKWSLIYLNDADQSVVAGDYPTREECSKKLQLAKRISGINRPECGKDCKLSDVFTDMYVCDQTFEL